MIKVFMTLAEPRGIMPFGKYKGKKLSEVPAVYLLWLLDKGCINPIVIGYIQENEEAIRNEAKNIKKSKNK